MIFDPSGEITFTPDPSSSAGTIELEYSILDAFGATANGIGAGRDPPRHVEQRAQRGERHGGRPWSASPSRSTCWSTTPIPTTTRSRSPASRSWCRRTATRTRSRRSRSATTASSSSCRPSPATTCSSTPIIDGSERDAAYIRVRVEPEGPNRPPIAVRDDITIGRGGTRNVYVLENDVDPDGDVVGILSWTTGPGHRDRAGARVRVPRHRARRRTGAEPVHVHDLRRAQRARHRQRRRRRQRRRHAGPATGRRVPTPSRCGPVRRPRHACWSTTTTPRAARLRVVNVSPVPGADLRIGPGRAGDLRVGRPRRRLVVLVRLRRRRRGRQPERQSLVQVRLVPDGEANRPPVARPDVARTVAGRAVDIPVLANDSDPDGDAIQTRDRSPPSRRSASPPRSPTAASATSRGSAQSGSDRLRYTIVDANGDRAVGEVVIGVLPADGENRPPTATNDTYTVIAGSDIAAARRARQRLRPRRRSAVDPDVDSGSDAVAIDDVGRDQLRTAARRSTGAATQDVSFAYEIADGRGGTDPALVDGRGRRDRRRRWRRSRSTTSSARSPAAGSVTVNVLANDSDPDGRVAELTVRRRRSRVPDRRRRHADDHRPPGDDPPRLHDHRPRRPDGHRPR